MLQRFHQLVPRSRRQLVRVLLVVSGLVLLGWAAITGERYLRARQHFQIALKALERDDLDLAQQHLDRCLQVWNNPAAVSLLAAQTARRREDFDQADAYLSACERREGDSEAARLERQLLIAQQGEPDRVFAQLETIGKTRPAQAVPILESLGKGYLNSFVKTDALKCFNALLKSQPEHVQALLWRGKTYESLDRNDRALGDYQRAVELSPALDEARLRLGATLHRLGRSWEAVAHYECLCRRNPGQPEVLLGLARCRCDLHEPEEARRLLNAILQEHPEHGAALLELGRLEYHAGQAAEAEKWLRQAAQLAPNDHSTHRALLLCLKARGKEPEVRSCLARLEQIDAANGQVSALIHRARDASGDARLRWEIGQRLGRLGREQEAVSWYFAALGEDPHYRPAHAALANYFERCGQTYRASRQRRQAGPGKDS